MIENAFTISDAPATWFGPHVGGVDISPWTGTDQPPTTAMGWVRGRAHILTACVIDLDHDNQTNLPTFKVNGVELSTAAITSISGFSDQYLFYGFLTKKEKEYKKFYYKHYKPI